MTDSIPAAALDLIAQRVAPGSSVVRTWPLRGGISAHMTAVELRLPDGATRRVIARRPGSWAVGEYADAAAREYRVLQVVRNVGVAAPMPLLLDESQTILPAPYLVIEYTEGEVTHSPADATAFAAQVAAELARIHQVDAAQPALSALPTRGDWMADARREREIEGDEILGARRIRERLRAAWPLPHPNSPTLLHGDPWPGNLIWRDGRLAAFIDWEEAHIGDPLEDVAIARFDILSMLGSDAMASFTRSYASALPRVDMSDLPYWDLYAALRPVNHISGWAGGWADLGRRDITSSVLRAAHVEFVAQAMERLSD